MAFFNDYSSAMLDMADEGLWQAKHTLDPNEVLEDEPAPPDPQAEWEVEKARLYQERAAMQSRYEQERMESARRLGMLEGKVSALSQGQQPPAQAAQGQPKQSSYEEYWTRVNGGETPDTPGVPPAPPEQPTKKIIRDTLGEIGQEYRAAQEEEQKWGLKFVKAYPQIAQNHKTEIYEEWERLKEINPHMPIEQRYRHLERYAMKHFNQSPKNVRVPSGGRQPSTSNRGDIVDAQRAMSDGERMRRKNLETAKYVKERRADQYRRTSWDGVRD